PSACGRLTSRGTPLVAIAFSFVCGMFLFLPFPGWQQLIGFVSAAAVVSYAIAPLALGALRLQDPDRPRPLRLPAAWLPAPVAIRCRLPVERALRYVEASAAEAGAAD